MRNGRTHTERTSVARLREVFEMRADGKTLKEIGGAISISPARVRSLIFTALRYHRQGKLYPADTAAMAARVQSMIKPSVPPRPEDMSQPMRTFCGLR